MLAEGLKSFLYLLCLSCSEEDGAVICPDLATSTLVQPADGWR